MMRPAIFLISTIIGLSAFSQEDKIDAIQVEVHSDALTGEEVFIQVENMPVFPGCELEESENAKKACTTNKMMEHILQNLEYPESARNKGIAGTVFVKFVVNKEGYVSDVELLKGVDMELDRAAQAVLYTFPKMTPAMQEGRKVNVSYNLPVRFYLDDNEREENLRKYTEVGPKAERNQSSTNDLSNPNQEPSESLLEEVDQLPFLPRCENKLNESDRNLCTAKIIVAHIQQNVIYPTELLKIGLEGTVLLDFLVNSEGYVEDVKVAQGVNRLFDSAAVAAAQTLPKFSPGMRDGLPVKVPVTVPVEFKMIDHDADQQEGLVYMTVEEMPYWPSCANEQSLQHKEFCTGNMIMRHIFSNTRYPPEAIEAGAQGTVFVKFIVAADGTVTQVEVIEGVDPYLDAEAVSVVENLPKFIPGRQHGKAVNVSYSIPVKYSIRGGNFDSEESSNAARREKKEAEEPERKTPIKQLSAEELALAKEQMPIPYWAECLGANPEEAQQCMADAIAYYVQGQVKYPKKALYRGISGVVEVTFDVDKRGKTSNIHVSKPVHLQLDLEALRVMRKMPKFEVPTNVDMTQPIRYTIPIYFLIAE